MTNFLVGFRMLRVCRRNLVSKVRHYVTRNIYRNTKRIFLSPTRFLLRTLILLSLSLPGVTIAGEAGKALRRFYESSVNYYNLAMARVLLTSNGLSNDSIAKTFLALVDKPADDIKVAFVPTAAFVEPGEKDWLINDLARIKALGCWVDIVDIAQLTSAEWTIRVSKCDVLFVGGGNTYYLSYWMQQSGLFDALPTLLETKVYAGISAGSIVMGPTLQTSSRDLQEFMGKDVYSEDRPTGRASDKSAKIVPFNVRPHLNSPDFPMARVEILEQVAKESGIPIYGLDDHSAVQWIDGELTVISEGEWALIEG